MTTSQKVASILLRSGSSAYRRDLFETGIARHGFTLFDRAVPYPTQHDVLILWNRYPHEDHLAKRYESVGARVIVAENGYIGTDEQGGKLFALSLNYHNGAGKWHVGTSTRKCVDVKPWRDNGDFVLVLSQRGIGTPGVAMPRMWEQLCLQRLQRMTKRPVRVRRHPGPPKTDPYPELKGAWAAVTWGSGAGIKSIAYGVPVFHELRQWIGASAARYLPEADIEKPFMGDRLPMFERLAWAQWSGKEIENGEAFAHLLQ